MLRMDMATGGPLGLRFYMDLRSWAFFSTTPFSHCHWSSSGFMPPYSSPSSEESGKTGGWPTCFGGSGQNAASMEIQPILHRRVYIYIYIYIYMYPYTYLYVCICTGALLLHPITTHAHLYPYVCVYVCCSVNRPCLIAGGSRATRKQNTHRSTAPAHM